MSSLVDDDAPGDIDFSAALARPRREGQKLSGRRATEKKKQSADDRRRLRATGRTEQLNLRVRVAFKAEVRAYAKAHGLMPTEVIERGFALLLAQEEGNT